ncbi:MAG: hypothetical protein ACLFNN_01985 [Candidatus Paceibacterota bacterium]
MESLVIKLGTKTLMSEQGRLDSGRFREIAYQVAELVKRRVEVVIVSSGAIQAGREAAERIGVYPELLKRFNKKDIAGIGSRHLMDLWGDALNFYGLEVCETLVTYANWSNENERENLRKGILDCLGSRFVSVVNENDRISDEEIKSMEMGISENDQLAGMVAALINADAVLFLTAVGGIYDRDPLRNPEAKILNKIKGSQKLDLSGFSKEGTGGMLVKKREGLRCLENGVKKVAVAGVSEKVILDFVEGRKVGTEICL